MPVPTLRACALLAAGLAAPALALALDLRQAYEAAVAHDASIRAARAQADAQRERLPQALSQRLPQVALNATRNHNDLTTRSTDPLGQPRRWNNDYYSGSQALSLRQPLYRPGVSAQIAQARAQVEDSNALLERDEQSLVVRVGEAYFDALLARDQVALLQVQKASHLSQLDAARKSFAAGAGARTDIDEVQSRLDMTLAQELEVAQHVEFTQRRLEVLTGQGAAVLAGLDVQRFAPAPPQPARLEDWIARAEAASPELQALRAQREAAQLEVRKAEAGHLPTLDAVAQWSRSQSDSVTSIHSRHAHRSVGLQLNVPLYAGGVVSSQVRQALASEERAREALEAARRELGVRVHQEFRAMTEGVLRVRALEQAVRSAQQALHSNQKSLQAGTRTTLDVLQAEQQHMAALRDLAQARYRYLMGQLNLRSLVGEDRAGNVAGVNGWLVR
ncbi:TolC family outer membrane protein [Comamonas endophytica]|uniref:TolC family outer membrane protein n=1 Tax=Comamonas endophytica TaxID=2949090 RepID=A0ABY6GCK2_9BURK|nr:MULTISPECIES: TolC family outer membrane protein [unclassified Acidovorax]MCD2513919.1 TolC family outer membrane protein [Acidovorax sp. D4N7]UYG52087.1 TolC family outer membrane protein [Acidovorax sp. 5MLIR]